MPSEVRAFVCVFCPRKKRFASLSTANRHERRCFHNPTQKACATCQHFSYERYDQETGEGGPYCAEGHFNTAPGEHPFRSACEFWAAKEGTEVEG